MIARIPVRTFFTMALLSIFAACSAPQTQIQALYTVKERIALGEHKVVVYRIADTMSTFAKCRYVPVYRFDILNDSGKVKQQYLGAVQEFLSRVAGTLRPEQKTYLQSLPLKNKEQDSNTIQTGWTVPNYEGEISDVQDASSIIKTSYWSIDKISPGKAEEVFTTNVVSIPYYEKKLRPRRTINESLQLLRDGEELAYYDLKRYVLAQLGK